MRAPTSRKPGRPGVHAWSDAQKAEVTGLVAEGLTCSQIARRIGRSRNAVIGIISRLRDSGQAVAADRSAPDAAHFFSDEALLELLRLRERAGLRFVDIAARLKKTTQQCSNAYAAIRAAERAEERRV